MDCERERAKVAAKLQLIQARSKALPNEVEKLKQQEAEINGRISQRGGFGEGKRVTLRVISHLDDRHPNSTNYNGNYNQTDVRTITSGIY